MSEKGHTHEVPRGAELVIAIFRIRHVHIVLARQTEIVL